MFRVEVAEVKKAVRLSALTVCCHLEGAVHTPSLRGRSVGRLLGRCLGVRRI